MLKITNYFSLLIRLCQLLQWTNFLMKISKIGFLCLDSTVSINQNNIAYVTIASDLAPQTFENYSKLDKSDIKMFISNTIPNLHYALMSRDCTIFRKYFSSLQNRLPNINKCIALRLVSKRIWKNLYNNRL